MIFTFSTGKLHIVLRLGDIEGDAVFALLGGNLDDDSKLTSTQVADEVSYLCHASI